jgi:hypothetical protein
MTAARAYRYITWTFLSIGIGVLVISYAAICLRTNSWWPWTRVVHEDGMRTLLATILYFEHGARELLIDIILGVAIGGCLLFACPPRDDQATAGNHGGSNQSGIAMASGIAIAVILVGAVVDVGLAGLRDNLLQYHTRPFARLEWGSHWRYHLLERLALILGSLGIAGFLRFCIGGEYGRVARRGLAVFGGSLAAFAFFTAVFAKDLESLRLPLVDPVYLGHQAREMFTHVLATLPIAWGVSLLVLRPSLAPSANWEARSFMWPLTVASGILGAVAGLYVCIASVVKDSASMGQTKDLAMLIFPHFFEHVQTYVVVAAVALLVYRIAGGSKGIPSGNRQ